MNVEKHTTTSIETISYRLSSKNGLKHYQFFPFIAGVKKIFLRGISKRNQIFFEKKKRISISPKKIPLSLACDICPFLTTLKRKIKT